MRAYERFLKYVAYPTMSCDSSDTVPSTKKQLVLANALCDELKRIGLKDAIVDEYGYVYATLESNSDKELPTVGFIAHMDTSDAAPDEKIITKTVGYYGGDIVLNEDKGIVMKVSEYPYLKNYRGDHLIVSDGTTLIGADDKAGIAEIITAVHNIKSSGVEHGTIKIGFTPDEEIGRGSDHFNVEYFGADYAYTVDGGPLGELEYENFNAAGARVVVHGISIHPGSAKDKMKNASTIAIEFNDMLPCNEVPEKTEGYEGFHLLSSMEGGIELAKLRYIIRDHDKDKFELKKKQFQDIADALNEKYGKGTIELSIGDSYKNMKEIIEQHMYIIDNAKKAMLEVGVEPKIVPIRGGTDGARLSFMGLPCPNLCTGGENFHSRFEFVSIQSMDKITEIIERIITNIAK
ncbi:MAG: peptidase T [Clostridia bacterium]|nr:peptidase T [Clostridia bacterium]